MIKYWFYIILMFMAAALVSRGDKENTQLHHAQFTSFGGSEAYITKEGKSIPILRPTKE